MGISLGWMWGVMGILLAVPLTRLRQTSPDCHPSLIHISNLLAETPRPLQRGPNRPGQVTRPFLPPQTTPAETKISCLSKRTHHFRALCAPASVLSVLILPLTLRSCSLSSPSAKSQRSSMRLRYLFPHSATS